MALTQKQKDELLALSKEHMVDHNTKACVVLAKLVAKVQDDTDAKYTVRLTGQQLLTLVSGSIERLIKLAMKTDSILSAAGAMPEGFDVRYEPYLDHLPKYIDMFNKFLVDVLAGDGTINMVTEQWDLPGFDPKALAIQYLAVKCASKLVPFEKFRELEDEYVSRCEEDVPENTVYVPGTGTVN